ncbi:MAG: hypothetical protein NW208_15680 [Bryobacter sp.]|nr:hypothetical protein [Bryobacter sp.]
MYLLLGGCVPYANDYAPTRERKVSYNGNPRQLPPRLVMRDARAEKHFVYGVDPAGFDGEFRKVGSRVAFRLGAASGRRLVLEYRSPSPQSVHVKANGVLVGEFTADGRDSRDGRGQWSVELPAAAILEGMPTLVELESPSGFAVASVALEN